MLKKNRIKDNLTNWISCSSPLHQLVLDSLFMNSLLLVFYMLHMLCVYINTMPKKSLSWSNPIRHWKGGRELQNGDVPGGIQRSLLQPAGTEWCPSSPENVWMLYILKFAFIWKADGGCDPNFCKGSPFPVLIRHNAAALMEMLWQQQ